MFYRNGRGSAYCQKRHAAVVYETDEKVAWRERRPAIRRPFAVRLARYPVRFAARLLRGRFLRAFGDVVYACGYVAELLSPAREPSSGAQPGADRGG
jgi:hypothetical protein